MEVENYHALEAKSRELALRIKEAELKANELQRSIAVNSNKYQRRKSSFSEIKQQLLRKGAEQQDPRLRFDVVARGFTELKSLKKNMDGIEKQIKSLKEEHAGATNEIGLQKEKFKKVGEIITKAKQSVKARIEEANFESQIESFIAFKKGVGTALKQVNKSSLAKNNEVVEPEKALEREKPIDDNLAIKKEQSEEHIQNNLEIVEHSVVEDQSPYANSNLNAHYGGEHSPGQQESDSRGGQNIETKDLTEQKTDSQRVIESFSEKIEKLRSWKNLSETGVELVYRGKNNRRIQVEISGNSEGAVAVKLYPESKIDRHNLWQEKKAILAELEKAGVQVASLHVGGR